jgi:TctA family transporter
MNKGFAFWLLWVISVVLSMFLYYPDWRSNYRPSVVTIIIFILLGILGWAVFGAPIQ